MKDLVLLPILGEFLHYPGPSTVANLELRRKEMAPLNHAISEKLGQFLDFARACSLAELQEQFTRTFDLNPVCALEVGWHLFGEDYRRGRFLAFIRSKLAENGIKESGELPDHLIHILPLLGRMVPPEAAERLARDCVGRAVRQMVSALQEASNPFLPVIECIESVLVSCWGSIPDGLPVQSSAEPGREDFV